ncbi:O-antigen ligase family protein [Massilia sp. METH4]|uniref:O-antigen ligase family protein n=1 Tax=Massilia sp. METH4 TaxID=3123041 RepID=UPI0030CA9B2C
MNKTIARGADASADSAVSAVTTIIIHCLVFLLPFLTLIANAGVGLCSFGFLLAAIWSHRRGLPAFRRHLNDIRGVLTAFGAACVFAGLSALLYDDIHLRQFEKPVRMLLAVSACIAVLVYRPSRKALWWGLIGGAVVGACVAGYQRWGLGIERPGGSINAITFGDIVLVMGLMCLAAVLDFRGRQRIWPALGVIAGLIGMVATGTRGGWVAIVLAALLFLKYGHFLRGKFAKASASLVALLMAGAFFVPQTGMSERMEQGVNDVQTYFNGGSAFTNVGVRLELWKGAVMLAERHPWTPSGQERIKAELAQLVDAGVLQPFVLEAEHFHNDALQALVYGGVVGLLCWFATLLLPFLFFLRMLRSHESAPAGLVAAALAGLLLVLSYFSFGLTEVIFYSVRSTMFYVLMLFVLMGLCLAAKEGSHG